MLIPVIRRAVGLVAAPALALATLAALPAAPSYAAEADPAPAQAGVAWLTSRLVDGLLPDACPFYCGRNIDAALGLDAAGVDPAVLDEMQEGFESQVAGYVSYSYPDGEITHTGDVGGATAKTAVFAQLVDAPAGYGGLDLIDRLAGLVSDEPGIEGRVFDRTDGEVDYQYANTLGQAFAARALDDAGHAEAEAATEFLLQQQCTEGFFREGFSPVASVDQSCDGDAAATPSIDATALALVMLADQADDTDVQTVLTKGAAWLAANQHADGSFGSQPGSAGNANSTGMAGWALGELGARASAERAAAWVRGVQADDAAPCATGLTPQTGAVGFDAAAHAAGRKDGITPDTATQWQYATAQAVAVLPYAPATGTGSTVQVSTAGFRRPGTSVRVGATGLAPGDTVCVVRDGKRVAQLTVGRNGQALGTVALPAGTATRTFVLRTDAVVASQSFKVLGAKRLAFTLKKSVRKGALQTVRVTGLAPGESVRVFLRGKRVATGKATKAGVLQRTFRVGAKVGQAKVKVLGQFADRTNTKTFRVVR